MKSAGWWMTAPAQGASSCQLRSMLRFPRSTEGTGWRRIRPRPAKGIKRLYEAMEGFGGLVRQIRETVRTSNADSVNYRPLEILLQPAPWHRGHVVLIGDAAHPGTGLGEIHGVPLRALPPGRGELGEAGADRNEPRLAHRTHETH